MERIKISNRKLRRLNNRQQKKRGVGKFVRGMFEIWVTFNHPLSVDEYQALRQTFQAKLKEIGLLGLIGPNDDSTDIRGIISVEAKFGWPTEKHRQDVYAWLRKQEIVKNAQIGEVI